MVAKNFACSLVGLAVGNGISTPAPDLQALFFKMNETLIYTDTRPRARSTGHAFGFEGNLGIPVIIAGMISVFLLTMSLNGQSRMPLFAKFLLASLPTLLTIAYITALRSRKPPRFDLDLFASWVNGRSFQPKRLQPLHPFVPNQ